jgi:hypothetical protein
MTRMNRTGVMAAPRLAEEMATVPEAILDLVPSDALAPQEMRKRYVTQAEPIGTVPPPKAPAEGGPGLPAGATGGALLVFTDKLGERLAFERTGVRLYDALLLKAQATPPPGNVVPMKELQRFREEELRHFDLVSRAISGLGGDPTAVTPSADVIGVASMGIMQVMTDPRTTVPQCLCALQTAEATDTDGWELLVSLAGGMGHDELARDFAQALKEEQQHLMQVRSWVEKLTSTAAGIRV